MWCRLRNKLSDLLVKEAKKDPKFIVLSGDHGYALFDALRKDHPSQFINCGIAEQSMVGIAAGLARQGFRVVVYGLASFIPIRVLEQIKLDICFSNAPVVFIGDAAGVTYSTLGASHHCGEDIAALMPMPNMTIYSPCDSIELEHCFNASAVVSGPVYIRLGKADRPACSDRLPMVYNAISDFGVTQPEDTCVVATGSLVHPAFMAAKKYNISCFSVPKLKPFSFSLAANLDRYQTIIAVEEHSRHGGLYSALLDALPRKRIHSLSLKDQFSDKCGSYQYALSEHELDDESINRRINAIIQGSLNV